MKKRIFVALMIGVISLFVLGTVSVSAATVNVSTVSELQSTHPYSNGMDKTWVYTHPSEAENLEITFSSDTMTEADDCIYILDGNDNQIGKYSGTELAAATVTIPGNVVKIRLTSDDYVNDNGFTVTSIKGTDYLPEDNLTYDVIAKGSWGMDSYWILDKSGLLTLLTSEDVPDYYYVDETPWYAYREQIVNVKIEGSADRIGSYAFADCTNLKSVQCDGVGKIGSHAFLRCTSLKSVFIHGFYTGSYYNCIEDYAFNGCTSLKEISFPSGTPIGKAAFGGCPSLEAIYVNGLDTWSKYVKITGEDYAFEGVTATVYYPRGCIMSAIPENLRGDLTLQCSDFGMCGNKVKWQFEAESGTLTISGSGSPADYSSGASTPWAVILEEIKHIIVKDGITSLPSYIFEYCEKAETITLPDTLKSLAYNAFNDCGSLNNLILPASLQGFTSNGGFIRCEALTDVYYVGTKEEFEQIPSYEYATKYQQIIHYLVWNEKNPTCTEAGIEGHYTFDDTSVYDTKYDIDKNVITTLNTVPATGHVYDEWEAEDADNHKKECECGDVITESHAWDDGVVTQEPTYEADGVKTYTCTVCGHAKTEVIDKLVPEYASGDADGDGETNVKDVILIRRFITGGFGEIFIEEVADVNKDGEVNVKDVIMIRRYITGGYGVEL